MSLILQVAGDDLAVLHDAVTIASCSWRLQVLELGVQLLFGAKLLLLRGVVVVEVLLLVVACRGS